MEPKEILRAATFRDVGKPGREPASSVGCVNARFYALECVEKETKESLADRLRNGARRRAARRGCAEKERRRFDSRVDEGDLAAWNDFARRRKFETPNARGKIQALQQSEEIDFREVASVKQRAAKRRDAPTAPRKLH